MAMPNSVITATATTATPLRAVKQKKTLAPALRAEYSQLGRHHPRRVVPSEIMRAVAARNLDGWVIGLIHALGDALAPAKLGD